MEAFLDDLGLWELSFMSIIVTCGHENSGYLMAYNAMSTCGLVEAMPSKREHYTPQDLSRKINAAHKSQQADLEEFEQISPGKVWQALSVDLMRANLDRQDWGWADANALSQLDFWRDLDQQIHFVLVYSSPDFCVANLIGDQPASQKAVKKVLVDWQAFNTELLRFYNLNKERAILVNSACLFSHADALIDMTHDRFGLDLAKNLKQDWPDEAEPVLCQLVASGLVDTSDEARELFLELESSADLPGETDPEQDALIYRAWSQYRELQNRIEQALNRSRALGQESNHARRENTLLLLQLHQAQEELEQSFLKSGESEKKIQKLERENRELVVQRQQFRSDNADLARRVEKLGNSRSAQHDENRELNKAQKRLEEQGNENELLLLQLHQVQEELEHYFRKFQEIASEKAPKKPAQSAFAKPQPKAARASETLIDMRHFIDGQNWFSAEHDGRWAGPLNVSTISLPKLPEGHYRLELDVVDAVAPDIVRNLKLSVNGAPLKVKQKNASGLDGPLAPFKRAYITYYKKGQVYPLLLTSDLYVEEREANSRLSLEFEFPELISPVTLGSHDTRELAIRLRQIKILPR